MNLELTSGSASRYAPFGGCAPSRIESLGPAVGGPGGCFAPRHLDALGSAPSRAPLDNGGRIRRFGKSLPAGAEPVDRLEVGLLSVLKHPQSADGYRGREHQNDQVNHVLLLTSWLAGVCAHPNLTLITRGGPALHRRCADWISPANGAKNPRTLPECSPTPAGSMLSDHPSRTRDFAAFSSAIQAFVRPPVHPRR